MSYATFKPSIIGPPAKKVGDGQCVSLVVNNPQSYMANTFPGVAWQAIFPPVSGAKQLFADANPKYLQKIANDHSNAAQLPKQGDVMVFDATGPNLNPGYTNKFDNEDGHAGVCDHADSTGYWLLQQNAPAEGQAANVTFYPWNFRPCIGWLRPIVQTKPTSTTTGATMEKVTLNQARIMAYHIAGRNGFGGRPNALTGACDADLNKNHVGHDLATDLVAWYNSAEGKNYREKLLPAAQVTKANVVAYINKNLK